ncbi:MAG: SpoIIE family protein phosphatase [Planctomycetota bacterium]
MTYTLRILTGNHRGKQYDLVDDEVFVGRDRQCQIVIDDDSVSRRHARLKLGADGYVIEDLRSRNGTYVNGRKIEEPSPLEKDDRVEIGVTEFVFRPSGSSTRKKEPAAPDPDVLLTIDATGTEDTSVRVNAEGKLRAILQITKLLGSTLEIRRLLAKMLGGLFEMFPQADRGLVLLRRENRLVPAAVKNRHGRPEKLQYSKTIVGKVVSERKAILSQDVARDHRVPATASITKLNIHSVMCVPLISQGAKVLGVIQLDTQDQKRKFDREDMEILTSVASQASVSVEHAQRHRATMEHAKIERELELAREVQQSFLPTTMPEVEGYRFWAHYRAARHVGGDFYDFLHLPNGNEAILLGDVAGKGIPAALMMVKVLDVCKLALLSHPDDPGDAMRVINREIHDAGSDRGFVTLALSVINPDTHDLSVAVAGHMPPMIHRSDGTIDESAGYQVRGRPLGIERQLDYEVGSTTLAPGELVVLFSDGISEAMNADREPYSVEQIREQLSGIDVKTPSEAGQILLDDVDRYVGDAEQHDDLSLVIFQRAPLSRQ